MWFICPQKDMGPLFLIKICLFCLQDQGNDKWCFWGLQAQCLIDASRWKADERDTRKQVYLNMWLYFVKDRFIAHWNVVLQVVQSCSTPIVVLFTSIALSTYIHTLCIRVVTHLLHIFHPAEKKFAGVIKGSFAIKISVHFNLKSILPLQNSTSTTNLHFLP